MGFGQGAETTCKVACVQLRCGLDRQENFAQAQALIERAAARGATYIQTPENTHLVTEDAHLALASARHEEEDDDLSAYRALALRLKVWLHLGSMAFRLRGHDKCANRSLLISPQGTIAARYDKIHLFDVALPDGETYRESDRFLSGNKVVVADAGAFHLGLSICYDLRFARLYRALTLKGALVLSIPSCFTQTTGSAHWHTLVRARAIENGAFVIAAAQGGRHPDGRETFGHSLIVGPWGEVLAEGDQEPGLVEAQIDLSEVLRVRRAVPGIQNELPFA